MPAFINEDEVGFRLAVVIGEYAIPPDACTVHVHASIRVPYVQATVRVMNNESIASFSSFVIGQDAIIGFSGTADFEEIISLPMSIVDVKVANSSSLHTPTGEVEVRLVSRWAYQEKSLGSHAYPNITNVEEVIKAEHEAVGIDGALDLIEGTRELSKPINVYRTQGVVDSMLHRIMPWVRSESGAPLFWYQTLTGRMRFHSAVHMKAQPVVAGLFPDMYDYEYEEHPSMFAYGGRSYRTNPKRTDLFTVSAHFIGEDEEVHAEVFDQPVEGSGRAIQRQRDNGPDVWNVWYVGYRSPEQIEANSAYLRRNHALHQVHSIVLGDFEAATVCDAGTQVKLYDLVPYIPDGAEHVEEFIESSMSAEYIVATSHLIWDGINEDGFRGTKLDLVKLAYDSSNMSEVPDVNSYVEV